MGARRSRPVGLLVVGLLCGACGVAPVRLADPLSAEQHNDLGVAYYARGDHALAAREFRRALALRPAWVRAAVNLGDAQLATGEIDAAIASYERARAAASDDPGIANNLAWALLQHEERWREAEPIIRDALRRDPEPRGYYLDTLGLALLRRGAAEDALAAFRAALADPALRGARVRASVLRHAGQALTRLGDPAAAERCYRVARALVRGPGPAWGERPGTGDADSEVGDHVAVC